MEAPDYKSDGYTHTFSFETWYIRFIVSRIHGYGSDTTAQIQAVSYCPGNSGHIYRSNLRLTSASGKESFIRAIRKSQVGIRQDLKTPWEQLVESVCEITLDAVATSMPEEILSDLPDEDEEPMPFLIHPIIPENQATLLFAERGSGKSTLACLLSILVQSGHQSEELGLRVKQANVLYLDWENQRKGLIRRWKSLCLGFEIPIQGIVRQGLYSPFEDQIDVIREKIVKHRIGFVIVDSFGFACGPGNHNDPEPIQRFFRNLNSLGITSLVLDHVAKNTGEDFKPTPFGSSYKENSARASWNLVKSEGAYEESRMVVSLRLSKFNDVPFIKPLGYEIFFDRPEGAEPYNFNCIRVKKHDPRDDPDLRRTLTSHAQITHLLSDGRPRTVDDISDETGLKDETVRKTLLRDAKMPDGSFRNIDEHKRGLSNRWVLRSNREDPNLNF